MKVFTLLASLLIASSASAKNYGQEGATFHLMPPTWSVASAQKKQEARKQRAINWTREHTESRINNFRLRQKMKAERAAAKATKK